MRSSGTERLYEKKSFGLYYSKTIPSFACDTSVTERLLSKDEKLAIKVLSQGAALRFLLTRVFDYLNTIVDDLGEIMTLEESFLSSKKADKEFEVLRLISLDL